MKRNKLTDTVLFKTLAIPIVVDIVLALIWIIVSPMTTIVVPSLISETSFEHFCASDSSFIFQTIVLLIKVPWLFWGLSLAWQTRRFVPKIEKIWNVVNCVTMHNTSCNYRKNYFFFVHSSFVIFSVITAFKLTQTLSLTFLNFTNLHLLNAFVFFTFF